MPDRDPPELERLAALGLLAATTASGLAEPLARVRAALADVCDLIDRQIAASRGPDPLPRPQVSRVRETVADAFLDVSRAARLAADLAAVVEPGPPAAGPIDPNDAVERAVALAGRRVSEDCDLSLDMGTLPAVRCDAARLAQVMAHLLLDAADAVRAGGGVTLRTFEEGGDAVIAISWSPAPPTASPFAALVQKTVLAQGGTIAADRDGDRATTTLRFRGA